MPTNWNDTGLLWDAASQTWPDPDTIAAADLRKTSDLRVMLHREGRTPIDVSDSVEPAALVNRQRSEGSGSATIVLPGLEEWTRLRAYTALLRVTYGPRVLFEGEIEYITATINGNDKTVTMEAFGLARRLEQHLARADLGKTRHPMGSRSRS